ncbi:MAG: ATP-binding protein [Candidatus Binatia bacterium]|nr:ATP-binding protein [Candidatus Binatia bacterium]
MGAARDRLLDEQLTRVRNYMRGCGLYLVPEGERGLRRELVALLEAAMPQVVEEWIRIVGRAFQIPEPQWAEVRDWMLSALQRWFRHIEDPEDVETYVFLRNHARRGFISHFPASRFLSGQMRLVRLFEERIEEQRKHDPVRAAALLRLLRQEFEERILHVTDFFVAGREADLREQEASYRQAVDNAPAAIFRVDCDFGTILGASRVAEKLVQLSREEMVGLRFWDLVPGEERQRVQRLLDEARRRGHARRDDLHLLQRDGERIPVFINAGLIEYAGQRFFQVICVDISERKRLESQLIQSEKMAAIGQLAAGIAHEIRNPLGIIANALFDLKEILPPGQPEVEEDLRIALEEMRRVQEIIDNLLEFSRTSRAETEVVDVNALLGKTLQLMQKSLQTRGVQVHTEFGDVGLCVANQNALRQVFLNLITNAVQAMPNGGELRIRTMPLGNDRIRLDFSDTGVGIPPQHLSSIFNPFFTTKEPGQGTGLGLSVVHSVVKQFRGEIRVQSQVNRGTTFTIELPRGEVDEEFVGLLGVPGRVSQ